MKTMSKLGTMATAATLSLALSACGGKSEDSDAAAAMQQAGAMTGAPVSGGAAAKVAAPTLAQGPDVCFKAIAKHIGANTKVSEITSFFSSGPEIDSSSTEQKGQLTTCSVQYQNPDDPRKLLGTRLDIASGQFDKPAPVEISVSGGNAAEFKLDDYLIPLSQLNPAALTAIMDSQKARLSGVYGKYAWTGVRLSSPDAFSQTHTLRLDVEGRLASNDIKESGYASITPDGKKITTNYLLP
jgi:hypothetical protein